jgi:hypothetical protein
MNNNIVFNFFLFIDSQYKKENPYNKDSATGNNKI